MIKYRIFWVSWAKEVAPQFLGCVRATCPEQARMIARREFGPIGNNQIIEARAV